MTTTLPEFLLHWAERTPERVFLAEPETGVTVSYAEAARQVAGLRADFRRRKIVRGDRVALLADNTAAWVTSYLAAMAHGAVVVPMNTRQAAADLAPVLADFDPAVIVGDPAYLTRVPDTYSGRLLPTDAFDRIARHPGILGSEALSGELGSLCYTSGTTGEARGVMLRHESLVTSARTFAHLFQSGPDTCAPVVVPLFHNTGYIDCLGHILVAGGRIDLFRRFNAERIGRATLAGAYSYLICVPTMYSRMTVALDGAAPSDAAPWLAYGGAPMPAPVAERFGRLVPAGRLVNVYGMSEATSITHYLPWRPGPRDLGAIGIAAPGTRDRISADGELQVASPTVMMGYWNDETATRAKFDGTWLRTGDLATEGEDGLVRIIGRIDDLINRGGEKFAPIEVEAVISAHPEVVEVAVVALADDDLGQIAGAGVVRRPESPAGCRRAAGLPCRSACRFQMPAQHRLSRVPAAQSQWQDPERRGPSHSREGVGQRLPALEPSPIILTQFCCPATRQALLGQGSVKPLDRSSGYAPRRFRGPDPKWLCQNGSILSEKAVLAGSLHRQDRCERYRPGRNDVSARRGARAVDEHVIVVVVAQVLVEFDRLGDTLEAVEPSHVVP